VTVAIADLPLGLLYERRGDGLSGGALIEDAETTKGCPSRERDRVVPGQPL